MRTPSKIDEDFQIFYSLGLHGWSDLFLISSAGRFDFSISHVFSDPPRCLIELCEAVIQNKAHRIALSDEPGGCIWEVIPEQMQLHIMTLSVFDMGNTTFFDSTASGTLVSTIRTKRRYLVSMLMTELWKPHNLLKEPSYQKGRSDFPHSELVALNGVWDKSEIGPSFLN